MPQVVIRNLTQPSPQPIAVGYCASFWSRLKGLMFRKSLDRDSGILMVQEKENRIDAAIHMFFVPFDLTVVWIDSHNTVVDVCLAKSWRPFYMPARPAQYILEVHPERYGEFKVGDQLNFENV